MTSVSWLKLTLIGAPGLQCGRYIRDGGETTEAESFKEEFGPCDEDARWCVGPLLLCQSHASAVAAEFGDDIAEIEKAWKAQL